MSQNQSSSYSFSSSSYSTSTSSSGSQSHTQSYSQQSSSNDRDGTTTTRRYEETGKPVIEEIIQTPARGQVGSGEGVGGRRIEDVSDDEQKKRDAEYDERMEDEYMKREGGA